MKTNIRSLIITIIMNFEEEELIGPAAQRLTRKLEQGLQRKQKKEIWRGKNRRKRRLESGDSVLGSLALLLLTQISN